MQGGVFSCTGLFNDLDIRKDGFNFVASRDRWWVQQWTLMSIMQTVGECGVTRDVGDLSYAPDLRIRVRADRVLAWITSNDWPKVFPCQNIPSLMISYDI